MKSTGSELAFIRVLRLRLANARAVSAFGRLWKTSGVLGRLRTSLGNFANDKNLTPLSQKKLAGIQMGKCELFSTKSGEDMLKLLIVVPVHQPVILSEAL